MRFFVVFFFFLFQKFVLPAQVPFGELTLEQCLQAAVNNSPNVKKSTLGLETLNFKKLEAKEGFFPKIQSYADLYVQPQRQVQVLEGGAFGLGEDYIPVRTGMPWNFAAGLSVEQLFLDPSMRRMVPAAKLGEEMARAAVAKSEDETRYQAAKLFFSILKTENILDALSGTETRLNKLEKLTNLLVSNTYATELEVKRIRVARTNLEAQKSRLTDAINYQKDLLRSFCGWPENTGLQLKKQDNLPLVPVFSSESSVLMEEKLLLGAIEMKKIQQHHAKAIAWPTLSGMASFGLLAPRTDGNFFDPQGAWYGASMLGLRLRSPIYKPNQAKVGLFDVEMKQLNEDLRFLRAMQQVEQRNAVAQLETGRKLSAALEENVALATEILTKTELRYQQGQIGLTEVLEAQAALTEATTNLAQQRIELRLAELEILKIQGKLGDLR